MNNFIFSGKRKINLKSLKNTRFLYKLTKKPHITPATIRDSLKEFFQENPKVFSDKKICVVIPDNTRDFHPKLILPSISAYLKKTCKELDFFIALGLHKKLSKIELESFLGKKFTRANNITQHCLENTKSIGRIGRIPLYLNSRLFSYDAIFTVGIVEPHLYAGFSGGIKCIGIGLAGKKTILTTHAVKFLSRSRVRVSNIDSNPFQEFLQKAVKKTKLPIYSLNIVNDINKQIVFYSLGKARKSFLTTVKFAKELFSYKTKERFDILFVGCDFPKDKNLYQASRLFNYVLDKRPLVKKGGAIFVFANLDSKKKSKAESNFEEILHRRGLSSSYKFKKAGEHRAFKVIEASKYANLGIITPNKPIKNFCIQFFKNFTDAKRYCRQVYGDSARIGIIPSGFSFIPK